MNERFLKGVLPASGFHGKHLLFAGLSCENPAGTENNSFTAGALALNTTFFQRSFGTSMANAQYLCYQAPMQGGNIPQLMCNSATNSAKSEINEAS